MLHITLPQEKIKQKTTLLLLKRIILSILRYKLEIQFVCTFSAYSVEPGRVMITRAVGPTSKVSSLFDFRNRTEYYQKYKKFG